MLFILKNTNRLETLILAFILFLIINNTYAVNPVAMEGILDLRGNKLNNLEYVKLRGEWALYWSQMLNPDDIDSIGKITTYEDIPGKWSEIKIDNKRLPGKGYITLRLKILTDNPGDNYSLKFMGIGSASIAYLNNKIIFSSGKPGISRKSSIPGTGNGLVNEIKLLKENDLILQVSNYQVKSGGVEDILLGKTEKLENIENKRANIAFFLFGSIFIMFIYHLGLYIIRRKNITPLYFAIFCILIAIRTLLVSDRFILDIIKMSWYLLMKMEYLTFFLAAPAFIYFTWSIFPKIFSKYFLYVFVSISCIVSFIVILTPVYIYCHTLQFFQIITGIGGLYVTYVTIQGIKRKKKEALIFLMGWIILFIAVINDILYYNEIIHYSSNLASVGLYIFIIFQAFLLASQFSKAVFQSERLAKKLNYTNRNLSKIVDFRTSELEKQKQELIYQKIEIEEKNNDITDSLNYARKIQTAVLPEKEQFEECFNDFFIYYEPKDIVSGDFYWIKRIRNNIIIAAADCTGHGVPGAFMSLLGMAFLNEIVNMQVYKKEQDSNILPNKILHELRKRIKSALRQTGEVDEAFDGIDMSLCIIDYAENKLYFSGANSSLHIVSKTPDKFNPDIKLINENKILISEIDTAILADIRGNRMPIGTYLYEKSFTNYEFNLDEIYSIYMLSDGYADQIGGELKTKFRLKRLKQLILETSDKKMEEQCSILKQTMSEWMCEEIGQIDDITIIGIKLHADREERSFGVF